MFRIAFWIPRSIAIALLGVLILAGSTSAALAGTPEAPEYVGGADGGGLTNTGSASLSFGISSGDRPIQIQGDYAFVLTSGSSTDCSQTAAGSNGCELKVFDISDPTAPTYVGGADASGSVNSGTGNLSGLGMYISGDYLYTTWIANSTACSQTAGSAIGCELKVFDISDPAAPTYVGGADASGSTNAGTVNINSYGVYVSGNYAYTTWGGNSTACSQTAGSALGCELKVFDISDPSEPTYIGGVDGNGAATGAWSLSAFSIYISGNAAYTAWAGNSGTCSSAAGFAVGCELKVFDISDPSEPTYIGGVDASGSANTGTGSLTALGIYISETYAYTVWGGNGTACSQTVGSAIGCELKVFDISDSAALAYLGGADSGGLTNAGTVSVNYHEIMVTGEYAYIAGSGGNVPCNQTPGGFGVSSCELRIFDLSDPTAPAYVGGYDADGTTTGGNIQVMNGAAVSRGYLFTTWDGVSATVCGQTTGPAHGCEFKVWHIGDTEAPTVSLTAPADSATVSGDSVTLSATASDNIGVAGVAFYVNSVQVGSEDTSAPFSVSWDSTATSSGSKTIVAVARDAAGYYATSSARTVTVANEPGFSDITATPGPAGATITWTTAAAASSRVFFRLATGLASSTPEINTGGGNTTDHTVTLTNLPSCTVYTYQVVSTNAGSDTATSSERTFATTDCTGSASIATSSVETITAASGGTLTTNTLTLTVPTSFTGGSAATFQISQLAPAAFDSAAGAPTGRTRTGLVYQLTAYTDVLTTLTSFTAPLTVTVSYTDSDVADLDESTLTLYRHDGSSWNELSDCATDSVANTVTCTTTAFSTVGLFAASPAQSSRTTSTRFGCTDPAASNYKSFTNHKPELCVYDTTTGLAERLAALMEENRALFLEAHRRGLSLPLSIRSWLGPVALTVSRDLDIGDSGEDVRQLQQYLMTHGYTIPAGATGYFHTQTQAALAAYQTANGITPAAGYFGPRTRASLGW